MIVNNMKLVSGKKVSAIFYMGSNKVEALASCDFLKTKLNDVKPIPLSYDNLSIKLQEGTTIELPEPVDGVYTIRMSGVLI